MAKTVYLYQYFSIDADEDAPHKGGSLAKSRSITLADGEVYDQTFSVAASGIVKIWDKTENEAMGDFDFGWIEADLDVLLEYTSDAGTSDVYVTQELKGSGIAGEMGAARVLNSDRMDQLDGTINTFDGTEDTIDEIWVKNTGSDTARVRICLAT